MGVLICIICVFLLRANFVMLNYLLLLLFVRLYYTWISSSSFRSPLHLDFFFFFSFAFITLGFLLLLFVRLYYTWISSSSFRSTLLHLDFFFFFSFAFITLGFRSPLRIWWSSVGHLRDVELSIL